MYQYTDKFGFHNDVHISDLKSENEVIVKIGIGITTHNRNEVAEKTLSMWRAYLPDGAKLVCVDDCSDDPFRFANYRFNSNVGIAVSKNKCIELLDDCDYIFLADDDIYPIVSDWYEPYISSGEHHLCLTFDKFSNGKPNGRIKLGEDDLLTHYKEPCGVLLFMTKRCIENVGGMDPGYGKWGYEHLSYSMRIYNAGLSKYPFPDLKDSIKMFYAHDYHQTVTRSVEQSVRNRMAYINERKYKSEIKSSKFIPYKQQTGLILTTYLTGNKDTQRGENWKSDITKLLPLIKSANQNSCEVVVFHDCFSVDDVELIFESYDNVYFEDVSFHCTEVSNPYFQRWHHYSHWLDNSNNKAENVWIVDATDVEVLKRPFQMVDPNKLYCGWENNVIGCQWMLNNHQSNFIQNFIKSNMKTKLLNAGVMGGRREIVSEFLDRLCEMYEILPDKKKDMTDMPLFNWVLYSHFLNRFETGINITTEFKSYKSNNISLFKHK